MILTTLPHFNTCREKTKWLFRIRTSHTFCSPPRAKLARPQAARSCHLPSGNGSCKVTIKRPMTLSLACWHPWLRRGQKAGRPRHHELLPSIATVHSQTHVASHPSRLESCLRVYLTMHLPVLSLRLRDQWLYRKAKTVMKRIFSSTLRILQRSSNNSAEPFLPRFSLAQRSFGRGRTRTRQDPRSAFRISGPVATSSSGPGFHAPPANTARPNNRRLSIESTDSDPLW